MNQLARLPPPRSSRRPARRRRRDARNGTFGVLDIGTTKVVCLIARVEGAGTAEPRVLGFGWQRARGVKRRQHRRSGGGGARHPRRRRPGGGDGGHAAPRRHRQPLLRPAGIAPAAHPMADRRPRRDRGRPPRHPRRGPPPQRRGRAGDGARLPARLHRGRDAGRRGPARHGLRHARPRGCTWWMRRRPRSATSAPASLRCDLEVEELVSAPFAAGLATLVEDEKQLGATVIDMGGGTTTIAVFGEGHLLHTAQLPVGGWNVTNDLARGLSTPLAHAERLKTLHGGVLAAPDDEREWLPVPLVGEDEDHIAAHAARHGGQHHPAAAGGDLRAGEGPPGSRRPVGQEIGRRVVLTGGGSQLVGARELAARVLDRQVRLGRPHAVRGLPETASGPAFAATLGLLAWGAGEGRPLLDLLPGRRAARRNVPPRGRLVAGPRLMRFTRKTCAPMRVSGKSPRDTNRNAAYKPVEEDHSMTLNLTLACRPAHRFHAAHHRHRRRRRRHQRGQQHDRHGPRRRGIRRRQHRRAVAGCTAAPSAACSSART